MINGNSLPRIAVVGQRSLIGEAVLDELRARKISHAELHVLEDERNLGRPLAPEEGDDNARAPLLTDVAAFDFARADLVFFCGRAALAERYAEAAAAHAWVIDGSSAFRSRGDVPLIVADLNCSRARQREGHAGVVWLRCRGVPAWRLPPPWPPCTNSRVSCGVRSQPIRPYPGSGRGAIDELAGETVAMLSGKKARGRAFGRQIAFNVIPQVDALDADGVTREERRLWEETRRILDLPLLAVNATAVRVPVYFWP